MAIFTFQVQCIVSCPNTEDPLPGVHDNYDILWLLCGGGDHAGHVTVVKVSLPSPPQVVESFHVCESNILCGVYVERTCGEERKFKGTMSGRFGFPFPTVWLGTQGGRYHSNVQLCLACVTVDFRVVTQRFFTSVAWRVDESAYITYGSRPWFEALVKYFCLLVLREGSKLLGFCVSSDEDVSQRLDKNHLLVYSDFLHCVVLTSFRTGLDSFWAVWYREETKT